jgi:exoribonuclease R
MPQAPLHIAVDDPAVLDGLARIRTDFEVPLPHPPHVVDAAWAKAETVLASLDDGIRQDARAFEFVTIDPPGSRDLDQAVHIEPLGDGWRVRYAIADVAAFVEPGGVLDAACWERGVTFYMPDGRAPLHPDVMGEGAASLLPGEDRAAVLWTVDLAGDGSIVADTVARAVVRSRYQLDYQQVQQAVARGTAHPGGTLMLLREVGEARLRQEEARGGVSLDLPTQSVEADNGGYRLEFETTVPSMTWNAQISLLVGMVAARRMVTAGMGLLRTMPQASPGIVGWVKHTARALHVDWPHGATYAEVVGKLDGAKPDDAAVLALASRGLRGAGYLALPADDTTLETPGAMEHAAVAAPYAHVTAPLRRLGDRYAAETCLAIEAGIAPPDWVTERLPALPDTMRQATGREAASSHAVLDLVEALVLRNRVGDYLDAVVVAADKDGATVVIRDPAIQARVRGEGFRHRLGDEIVVRVDAADPVQRKLDLHPV